MSERQEPNPSPSQISVHVHMRARVLCVQVESISPKSLYMWVVCARAHARMCVGRWVGVWRVGGGVAVHACEVVPVCESARVGVRGCARTHACRHALALRHAFTPRPPSHTHTPEVVA